MVNLCFLFYQAVVCYPPSIVNQSLKSMTTPTRWEKIPAYHYLFLRSHVRHRIALGALALVVFACYQGAVAKNASDQRDSCLLLASALLCICMMKDAQTQWYLDKVHKIVYQMLEKYSTMQQENKQLKRENKELKQLVATLLEVINVSM